MSRDTVSRTVYYDLKNLAQITGRNAHRSQGNSKIFITRSHYNRSCPYGSSHRKSIKSTRPDSAGPSAHSAHVLRQEGQEQAVPHSCRKDLSRHLAQAWAESSTSCGGKLRSSQAYSLGSPWKWSCGRSWASCTPACCCGRWSRSWRDALGGSKRLARRWKSCERWMGLLHSVYLKRRQ